MIELTERMKEQMREIVEQDPELHDISQIALICSENTRKYLKSVLQDEELEEFLEDEEYYDIATLQDYITDCAAFNTNSVVDKGISYIAILLYEKEPDWGTLDTDIFEYCDWIDNDYVDAHYDL